jgi:hypothetical protein
MECSAMLIGNLDEMPKEKVEMYVIGRSRGSFGYVEDPRKLMFGTDWPLTVDEGRNLEAYKKAIPQGALESGLSRQRGAGCSSFPGWKRAVSELSGI